MSKTTNVEEIVKFVMDTANGIDDYNWGQDKFEEDLRNILTQHHQDMMSDLVKKLEGMKIHDSDDTSRSVINMHGYNDALIEAQTIIKTLSDEKGNSK